MSLQISKILISDEIDLCCKEIFERNSIIVDQKPGLNKEELKEIIGDYDALIVRSATKVTEDILHCAKQLQLVGRAGTGVDNVDLTAASKQGILVMNTPGGNTLSAAEHTCAMISALARNIGQGYCALKEGRWDLRSKFMGCELMEKTLAIVGLGKIGKEVALRMQSFGMKTVGFDPVISKEDAAIFNVEYMSLEEMWPVADFITLHVPLIPATAGMINQEVFGCCKFGVRIVNVARGGIIDETDLLAALESGQCGGAALDVFATEPPKDVSWNLVQHPKVLATPHLGASTTEAQKRVAIEIAEQIVDGVNGRPMVGLVNAPALAEVGNPVYRHWLSVSEKLGVLLGRVYPDVKDIDVVTSGADLTSASKLILTAFSCGLAKTFNTSSNMINAISMLDDAGYKVNVNCETGNKVGVSVKVNHLVLLHGSVSENKPILTMYDGIELKNQIVLTNNLVVAACNNRNPKELMKMMLIVDVVSVSTGCDHEKAVVVGVIDRVVGEALPAPLKFIQLM